MISYLWTLIANSCYVVYFTGLYRRYHPKILRMEIRRLENILDVSSDTIEDLRRKTQQLEDMLANRNTAAVRAQTLYVTEHALDRYRKRIGFNGSDDELRKMIYKLTIRHLATMDSLPDGEYTINDQAMVRVKDNTVCTVIPYKKRRRS